ncbi:heterokaryon incompatibility protein [Fusarium pseudoanthophilum]|uniref:Heterokaryon incompatibility protein n=1 Tax=Fusarium pseudoanthophilum TaxID=48495 RepID=A0A8H5UTF9_9HYPO|nr:heterokaryon incompatibility protein [Fusarium pseudoanthophilum]
MVIYKQLRRDTSQIRLVRVLPPSPHDSRLSLDLRHGYIEDGTYSALSYVWGDASEQEYILVNRVLFRIRRNLYQALMQLRSNGVTGWLWIDSLCIQQKDIDEKSYQVGLMRAIFSSASCVYSWLGKGTTDTDVAMDFCARIGSKAAMIELDKRSNSYLVDFIEELFDYQQNKPRLNPKYTRLIGAESELVAFFVDLLQEPFLKAQKSRDNELSRGLHAMMNHEYWKRIWINQEVALAKNVIVLCGGKSESLGYIEQTIKSLELWSRFHPCIPIATDPRDLIFALLGVITNSDKLGIQADYRLSLKEVFTAATRAMYECVTDDLDIDLCIASERQQVDIPSWVIDWRKVGPESGKTWPINDRCRKYHATGNIDRPAPVFIDGDNQSGILRKSVYLVDSITEVWRYPEDLHRVSLQEQRGEDKIRWMSSIIDFMQLPDTSGPGEDYVWRTLQPWFYGSAEDTHHEVRSLIRSVMRQEDIRSENVTVSQRAYLDTLTTTRLKQPNWTVAERLSDGIDQMRNFAFFPSRGRALFKTQKGMLGLGQKFVEVGDTVTLSRHSFAYCASFVS